MSSVGQALGGLVGGVVGFFTPVGPLYGAQIGMMLGGWLDPPKGPVITGPRLEDLTVQTSTYGSYIPRVYSTISVTGNVIWLMGDHITEVRKKEKVGGKGGPTQTNITFAYYATFAVALCKSIPPAQVVGIRRIWIGGQLWYDAGSDVLETIIASNEKNVYFKLYLGTDTQLADPSIQADKGVANVSAYRGIAYAIIDSLPLEKYGNSLAGTQIKVEVCTSATIDGIVYKQDQPLPLPTVWGNFWNAPYRDSSGTHVWGIDDAWSGSTSVLVSHYLFPEIGDPVLLRSGYVDLMHANASWTHYVAQGKSDENFFVAPDLTPGAGGVIVISDNPIDTGFWTNSIKTPGGGDALTTEMSYVIHNGYIYFTGGGTGTNFKITRATVYGEGATNITLPWEISQFGYYLGVLEEELVVTMIKASDSLHYFVTFDLDTLAYIAEVPVVATFGASSVGTIYCDCDGDQFIWWKSSTSELKVRTGLTGTDTVIGDINDGSHGWVMGASYMPWNVWYNENILHIWVSQSYASPPTTQTAALGTWSFGKLTPTDVTLASIVQAECLQSNLLTSSDIDVTELTDTVRGYRVSQLGAIRGNLEPLRAAWPFDVVQHGYDIKFKRRGSASVATITAAELDARSAKDNPGISVIDSREMDIVLPRQVTLKYFDYAREYDTNAQYSEHFSTDSVNEVVTELPIVLNADEAAGVAESLMDLYWMERNDVAVTLPPTYANLEPGDIITVTAALANYELRLTSVNYLADGRLECKAKYNKASIYTPAAKGEEGQSVGAALTWDGPSIYWLLDVPLMRDVDDVAGFPVAMTGLNAGWPGGILYRSDDLGETWEILTGFPSPGVTAGHCTTALSAHGGTVYDFASTLSVTMYQGTLASVSEASMFSGQNWFAYGNDGRWEIIAARTVTGSAGSYVLSDLFRGQFGTEWTTGLHVAGDFLVSLDLATLDHITVNSATIGVPRAYRGITSTKPLDTDSNKFFTYQGVNLECLSPVNLSGNRHPTTNDWTLTWTRRTRFGGWRDYVDAPLGEDSEFYSVEVYSDGTYTTLVRRFSDTAAIPTATLAYPLTGAVSQTTDFGGAQSTLYLKVYQLSATMGFGYPLIQSITRT